jgi:chemosensory pili system protein ChpA (sensor histidine kinase/response regulator)
MTDMAAQSLDLVSGELTTTLDSARAQLESYIDGQAGSESLMRCAELLHLASGALKIVEAHGAALLAEEMQETCKFLGGIKDEQVLDNGVETLTRAMVQLPAYIDRLLSGGRDVALVLLPLINDLRELTSRPILSEGTLVLLSAGPQGRFVATPTPGAVAETREELDLQGLAALRPLFQAALLGWIRGDRAEAQLAQLIDISKQVEQAAKTEPGRQIWYVLTAVLEALRDDGLEETVALKRLVGQADRQLKRLIDEGETTFVQSPPVELLNGLLYYVSRASGEQERLEELRSVYNLDELVPAEDQLAKARDELSAPSTKLMDTVAEAIKEDLGSVKDSLDIFVRTGMDDTPDLAPQLEMLKKIADTLGVLGLAGLRDAIRAEAKELKAIVVAGAVPEEASLEKIAATLLDVEDTLERELVRAVAPASASTDESAEPDEKEHYQRVTKTVLGECIVNLSHIKETVIRLLDDPGNVRALDQVRPQLHGITAGLLMLGKSRAVGIVERIGAMIKARLAPGEAVMDANELERLADSIVSIEYYMETVAAGRNDPWYMLDNSERCLELLERYVPAAGAVVPDEPGLDAADEAATIVAAEAPSATVEPVAEPERPSVMQAGEDRLDPELVELFIEEAKEEIAGIKRDLPAWLEDLDDHDALTSVRRAFHTLKGSGRMVGAQLIGEFCWSVEKILNRVINRTLPATEPMLEFIDEAAAALPLLVEQLEIGTPPKIEIEELMQRADSYAETGSEAVLASETMQMPVLEGPDIETTQASESPGESMDPVLAEIFAREAHTHLEAISEYLASVELTDAPYPIEEPLFRACHTLLGSATMASFSPLIGVIEPLANYVGAAYDTETSLDEAAINTLQRALLTMRRMVVALEENEPFTDDISELSADLRALGEGTSARQPEIEEATGEFDPEIVAIFSEEATEILDGAELALQNFRLDSSQTSQLAELQRLLHTLKGGARMAGMAVMGNLSHALEDLLQGMAAGNVAPTVDAIDVIQQSLDQLHYIRDAINSGHALQEPATLLERIDLVARGAAAADAQPAPSADEEPAVPEEPAVEIQGADAVDEGDVASGAVEIGADEEVVPAPAIDIGLDAPGTMTLTPQDLANLDEEQAEETEAPAAAELQDGDGVESQPAVTADTDHEAAGAAPELVRVDGELLDALLNGVGEINIFQSRLAQQSTNLEANLGELDETVVRLRDQLRQFEAETEAQILHTHQDDTEARGEFDPLELDRYSKIQQLSRALAETANDVASLNDLLRALANETSTLLTQQARVTTSVQDGLMQTRMVPFQRYVPRLARIVRQACSDSGTSGELAIEGAQGELDRQVIERMLAPLEHLLRNAVVHGIESPEERVAKGKPEVGRISLQLQREGSEVLIQVADDGAGLDLDGIRQKARELGILAEDEALSDGDAMELILRPGFTTAGELTHAAGRGVGMDVVNDQVKKLGGSLRIESTLNEGSRFILRLPYTLAVTHALIVDVGEETFALPLPTVEGVTRVPKDKLLEMLTDDDPRLDHGGVSYRLQHLGSFVGAAPSSLPEDDNFVSLVLVRAGENSAALLTDTLEGSREVVVKTLGPHLVGIPGISGATILGDGRIIIILDVGTLIRSQKDVGKLVQPAEQPVPAKPVTALVVDDSITMRRVTQRLLERHGIRVLTARDGMDAVTVLQDHMPDVILLDIEMPRMDGYQFATHVRNAPGAKDIPIIMITSRSGEKHRARAIEIGVNDYLSKPYQEDQLIRAISGLLEREL